MKVFQREPGTLDLDTIVTVIYELIFTPTQNLERRPHWKVFSVLRCFSYTKKVYVSDSLAEASLCRPPP